MGVSTKAFSKGLKDARGMVSSFTKSLNNINPAFLSEGIDILKSGFNALKDSVAEAFTRLDDTAESASAIGITTGALQSLQYATQMTGGDVEGLSASLSKMNNTLGSAKAGDGVEGLLTSMGLNLQDLQNMAPDEAFKQIATGISGIDNPAKKTAAAMDLFGRGGVSLINTLNAGGDSLGSMQDEAYKLGQAISEVDSAKIGGANDAFDKIGFAMEGMVNTIAIQLAPTITAISEMFINWATTSVDRVGIVSSSFKWIAKGIGVVADVLHTLKMGFKLVQSFMTEGIAYLFDMWGFLGQGIQAVINLLPGVEVNFTDTLSAIGDEMHKLSDEQFKELEDSFMLDPPSTQIDKWFNDIETGANKSAEALDKTKKSMVQVSESTVNLIDDIKKLTEKLDLQIATFGMSSNEIELYKLSQQGADKADIAHIKTLNRTLEVLEGQKKLKEDATSIIDGLKTPAELLKEEFSKLDNLLGAGLISPEQLNKAKLKAQKDILPDTEFKLGSAVTKGSQEARAITLKHKLGGNSNDPLVNLNKTNKEQLNKDTLIEQHLRILRDKAEKEATITEIAIA